MKPVKKRLEDFPQLFPFVAASSSAKPNDVRYRHHRKVKDQNSGNPPLLAYSEQSNCKKLNA